MSGEGVTPICNLTLANVGDLGVTVSGNGGPMDYKAAAHFLALGARTVQFCTVVMKYGYGIVDELHSGLSPPDGRRAASRSVEELIGRALPNPITGFMELTPIKKHLRRRRRALPALRQLHALPLPGHHPRRRPAAAHRRRERCIGCSICAQKCFAGALAMRERTAEELAAHA